MSVRITSNEEIPDGRRKVVFSDGYRSVLVFYWPWRNSWTMKVVPIHIHAYDIPFLEAAIHELKRLNGVLPPVRVGGMRPAKGGS